MENVLLRGIEGVKFLFYVFEEKWIEVLFKYVGVVINVFDGVLSSSIVVS